MDKSPQEETTYKSTDSNTVTFDLQPLLLPLAIVLSSIIFSVSLYASAARLSKGLFGVDPNSANQPSNAAAPGQEANKPPSQPQTATVSIDDDAIKGNKGKAKVGIVEFSDYQCPFCKRFFDDTLTQMTKEYIDTNKAILVYRDLPLPIHPFAQAEAEAAECAGEQGNDKYYAMHDKLFQGGGQFDVAGLKNLAKEIGLNTSKFDSCLDEGKMKAEVQKDSTDASQVGINGTPGFVIGKLNDDGTVTGEIVSGAQPYANFKTVIEKYL